MGNHLATASHSLALITNFPDSKNPLFILTSHAIPAHQLPSTHFPTPVPSYLCPVSPFPCSELPSTWAVSSPVRLSVPLPSTPLLRSEAPSSPSSCHTESNPHTCLTMPTTLLGSNTLRIKHKLQPPENRGSLRVLRGPRVCSAG